MGHKYKPPRRGQECRFIVGIDEKDVPGFREDLVALAGAFTEMQVGHLLRYVVGLKGRSARRRVEELLARWKVRARSIELEERQFSPDHDEIYFLLPLHRNPDPGGGSRLPLLTNEDLAELRVQLAMKFHFRPEMVRVYGEWRNADGVLVPDLSLLIRVPRRGRRTVAALRRLLRQSILSNPRCDQECLYLSDRWRGELLFPK